MRTQIAIVGTEFFRDYIDRGLKQLNLDLDYTIYVYRAFSELADIYQSIPERVTGIITTGSFPARILRQSFPESRRIIQPLNNDDADIFRLFFSLMSTNHSLSPPRIFADILEAAGLDTEEYLSRPPDIPFTEIADSFIGSRPLEVLMEMEDYYTAKHLRLWREKKIDVSITRFSSIVERLNGAGLKAHFVWPSLGHLKTVCQSAVQAVRIAEMRDSQVASILVSVKPPGRAEEAEARLERLERVLKRFNTIQQLDFIIKRGDSGFELLTDRRAVNKITDGFKSCLLREFIKDKLDFDIHIGYGLGPGLYQARINAVDAAREAARLPFGASGLINDHNELICPLKSEAKLVVPREISEPVRTVARKAGLSYLTVQKIMAVVKADGGGQITSRDLAHKLSITTRSANRFLSALTEAGLASIIEARRGTTKGRPERVYEMSGIH